MIVDFRVRPPFKGFNSIPFAQPPAQPDPVTMFPLHIGMEPSPSYAQRSMTEFMKEMDAGGIDVAVAMARFATTWGNVPTEDVAELVKTYPGRFVGFGAVDGADVPAAVAEVGRIADFGLRGVAMDNPRSTPPLYDDDERLFPIYERCQSLGLLLSLTSSIFIGPDLSYSMPVHIQRVAKAFPKLPIMVPHGGWPWSVQMCAVAFQCPNIYLVPDFYMYIPNTPGGDEYVKSANYFLSHRLLYASSYPVRPLVQSVRQFRELPFDSDEIRQRCLGGNAKRLLGL